MKRTASVIGGVVFGLVLGIVAGRITPAHAQYEHGAVYVTKERSPGFAALPTNIPAGSQVVGFSCVATGREGEDQTCFIATVK